MIRRLLLLALSGFIVLKVQAATRIALVNGVWESTTTWGGTAIPDCGDSIVIPQGKTVTITNTIDKESCSSDMKLSIKGVLNFQTGKKLKLPCGSRIYIHYGGAITDGGGGGTSNLIDICGTTVWTADQGTVNGSSCFPPDPTCQNFSLPVEFIGFNAINVGKNIKLQWHTATEKDNDFFTVERAGASGDFAPVAKIKGAGTSHSLRDYVYDDTNPLAGTSFYRIKQTDYNGSISYSGVVAIKKQKELTLNIHPNPSQGVFTVETGGALGKQEVSITITDCAGRIIYKDLRNDITDQLQILFKNSAEKNGVYVMTLKSDEYVYTTRVIVGQE